VATRDITARITRRARRAGLVVPRGGLRPLGAYLALLCRWNERINLTALPLDPPSGEAIDRLVIEPLVAAKQVRARDRLLIDIGSGGGSPGLPLALAAPHLRVVLVEVKVRKSAFLREAVRTLELPAVEIVNGRFEELLGRSEFLEAADLVSVRAVRPDRRLWNSIQGLLKPGGRVLWFDSAAGKTRPTLLPPLAVASRTMLVASLGSELVVVSKAPY
jgi:16S rRNA (guanine527-N7)-methyltransferase